MLDYIYQYADFGWNGLIDFILPFLIILSILVFVHEWGHYIVARWCGVHVETFSIGFGREIYGWTDKNKTRWKIGWVPLGGYVQMFGDTDPSSANSKAEILENEKSRPMTVEETNSAFFTKSVWQRAAIVFAGPAINFIFAMGILFILYTTVGKPVTPPIAAAVMVDGAGFEAGIQPQDRFLFIDGKPIQGFVDIQKQVAVSLDRPLDVIIDRNGEQVSLSITPKINKIEDRFGFVQSRGLIGIMSSDKAISIASIKTINGRSLDDVSDTQRQNAVSAIIGKDAKIGLPSSEDEIQYLNVRLVDFKSDDKTHVYMTPQLDKEIVTFGVMDALKATVKETWFVTTASLEAIGQIITGTRSATELGGIVRIGAIAGDAAQAGIIALITFTAMLSINLGLINLFPIPLLDGGHLVFYAYEAIFKKPMSEKVMDYALKMGMVFLVCLMAFANINDIVQIIR